jgi:tetratricopeptide (TPR) repeat protein
LANETDAARGEKLFSEGLAQLPDVPRYALDRAICLMRGAEIAHRAGHTHDAVLRGEAAQRFVEQALYRSDVTETDGLVILAGALERDGQVERAHDVFKHALAKLTLLGREDSNRAATLYNNWGVSLWLWGNPLEAEGRLRRGMELEESLSGKEGVKPQTLVNYARTLTDLDRAGEAAPIAERAYERAKALGSSFVVNQSLSVRSTAYRKLGQFDRADQMLDEEEPALRHLPPEHIAFAALASARSLNSLARGDLMTALNLANRAVDIAEASIKRGHEGGGYLEMFLVRRADVELQEQRLSDAERDARRVVGLLHGKTSVTLGRSYSVLGRALRAKGEAAEATSSLRAAVQQLETTLGPDNSETRAARQLLD